MNWNFAVHNFWSLNFLNMVYIIFLNPPVNLITIIPTIVSIFFQEYNNRIEYFQTCTFLTQLKLAVYSSFSFKIYHAKNAISRKLQFQLALAWVTPSSNHELNRIFFVLLFSLVRAPNSFEVHIWWGWSPGFVTTCKENTFWHE